MANDNNFRLDPEEIMRNVATAEVICLHFPLFRKTLVIDTRADVEDPPLLRLVPMAKSVEERFRSLKRLRPRFPQPEKVTIIPWPSYVDSLVRMGVWDRVKQRLAQAGHPDALRACDAILIELRQLERAELAAAVTGKQYHTIWQAPR